MAGEKKTIEELKFIFKNIMFFLKDCDIKLILFYGSLLGYYRNLSFINFDDDIDIIVSKNDFLKLIEFIENFYKKNINSPIKIGVMSDSIIQLFYDENGPFDIYMYEDYNDDILLRWDGNLLYNKEFIFPLKEVVFYNSKIFIPNNTEEILIQTYGKNWKIPQIKNIDYIWNEINNVKTL